MKYIDHMGKTWTRSSDGCLIECEDGRKVIGIPEMPFEHMVQFAYLEPTPIKTDADRIAELEAQVKALLAKLS